MRRGRPLAAAAVVAAIGGTCAPAAHAAGDPVVRSTFAALGTRDTGVQGTVATATTFVPVRPGYRVAGGAVTLDFDHSPLLRADRSTVTLLASGIPLGSARLTRANATGGRLRVPLPALPDTGDGVLLQARFSMRLTRDPCEDSRNAALWARVRGTSTVVTRLRPARRTVGAALATLTPTTPHDPVAIDTAGDAAALGATGTVAAALGRQAAATGSDPLVTAGDAADGGVTVATGDAADRALRTVGAEAPDATGGVLAVAASGPPHLVVGAGAIAGLRRAAAALSPGALTTPDARVATVGAAAPRAPRAAQPWRQDAASFAQLGLDTREATGPGVQELALFLDRPPQWDVEGTPVLDLVLDAGAGLDPTTSSVAVTVAGQPVGSRRLEPGKGPAHLRFELPDGLLDHDLRGRAVRRVPVTLRFDLQVDQRGCRPLDADAARVLVAPASTLTIPHTTTDDRDLSRWPAPLAQPGRQVDVVLPDDASDAVRGAGLQLVASIARWADPAAPAPRLTTVRGLGRRARDGDSLVLLGDADEALGLRIVDPVAARLRPGVGAIVLAASPWNGDRHVAAIHGDDAGLARAARALTEASSVSRLVGRAVHVAPGGSAQATAAGSPQAGPPALLAPVASSGDDDGLPVWAIPSGVVLLAFVTTGGLFGRRRWGRRARR